MKASTKQIIVSLIIIGYAVTWIFAPPMAARDCTRRARQLHAYGVAEEIKWKRIMAELGDDPATYGSRVRPGGPVVKTGIVFPLLPGVIVMQNSYVIGPLWGKGRWSVYLYYGFGVKCLMNLTTWIS